MKNNSGKALTLIFFFLISSVSSFSQKSTQKPEIRSSIISFSDIIKYDIEHPDTSRKFIGNEMEEEGEEVLPDLEITDTAHINRDPYGRFNSQTNFLGNNSSGTLNSVAPTITFNGLDDNNTGIPPDVNGAVGPNHVMTTLNTQVRIQNLTGSNISTVSLNSFWSSVGNPSTFDPKILYEPFNSRWIITSAGNPQSATSAILVGVSQTSDPTGLWNLYSIDVDATNQNWLDYPSLGFNKDWVVITGNIFSIPGSFVSGKVFVFKKADLYNHVASPGLTVITPSNGAGLCPAATYDNSVSGLYLLQRVTGNSGGSGYLNLYSITGAIGSEILSPSPIQFSTPNPWSSSASTTNSEPQLGTSNKIAGNDDRIQNVVYRNGSLWFVHTVFLPSGAPTRSAVQWWQVSTAGTILQRGRIDDGTGVQNFAFPSIAVNSNNDALIGYAKFSSAIYASGCYAIRASADPVNTFQSEFLYKAGLAPYFKDFSSGSNRWGDYTMTMTDPSGVDFWTIQEYAANPSGGSDRWGTWWAKVPAPCGSNNVSVTIASNSFGPICPTTSVTFTATPVNPGTTPVYQWKKNSVNVGTNSPTYIDNSFTNGTTINCVLTSNITCATNNPATSNTLTMTVLATAAASVSISASPATAICPGMNVTFTAAPVNGGGAPIYQWKKNGTVVGVNSPGYSDNLLANNDQITCTMTSSVSCPTGSPAPSNIITEVVRQVDDGNLCTTDACNTSTIVVTHTNVPIDDSNGCTTDACNTSSGAITHTAVNINDGNPCTNDACNTSTGSITHIAVPVDDGNACTNDVCNTSSGAITHNAVPVDDGNVCTIDGCNSISGVFHNPGIEICGNGIDDDCDGFTDENCGGVSLSLKLYIQGYYTGGGLMDNNGAGGNLFVIGAAGAGSSDVDTVVISAMDPSPPHNEIEQQKGVLKTDGNVGVAFSPTVISGQSYYIKVNHRNTLATWSKVPVLFTNFTTYDFTTSSSQAFDDGFNPPMKLVDPGKWALFNGDINGDGGVDSQDMTIEENFSNSGLFGYYDSDLNGDGGSDSLDMTIIEDNGNAGVFETHP